MLQYILTALFLHMTVAHFLFWYAHKNTTKFKNEKRKSLFLIISIIPVLNLFQLYHILNIKIGLQKFKLFISFCMLIVSVVIMYLCIFHPKYINFYVAILLTIYTIRQLTKKEK